MKDKLHQMRRITIAFLVITNLCGVKMLSGQAIENPEQLAVELDALVQQYRDLDIFSGVVLVAENGKPVYQKAFGLSNREKGTTNTLGTYFDIGSINKLFTKVLVMQLIEEGKIQPDDHLGKFLNGFPEEAAAKVTVKELIDHTSGYGDYMQEPGFFDLPKSQQTIPALVERIRKMPLDFEPGTEWQYSNAGYLLLGGIIEEVTGKPFYQNILDRIVIPLGMTHTVVDEKKEVTANRAIGYMKTMFGSLENNENLLLIPTPAGGFIMTVEDLFKFVEAYFFSDQMVSPAGKQYDDFYPFIQQLKKDGGAIPVAGGFEGANALALVDIQRHLDVIVLANMDEPVAENLGKAIYGLIDGKEPTAPALPLIPQLYSAYRDQGIGYLKEHFAELIAGTEDREPGDVWLNQIGYNLLYSGMTSEALQIFKLNTELFPDIANCWDSYGEALLKSGDRNAALKAYKQALAIRPDLPSALEAIKKLEN